MYNFVPATWTVPLSQTCSPYVYRIKCVRKSTVIDWHKHQSSPALSCYTTLYSPSKNKCQGKQVTGQSVPSSARRLAS